MSLEGELCEFKMRICRRKDIGWLAVTRAGYPSLHNQFALTAFYIILPHSSLQAPYFAYILPLERRVGLSTRKLYDDVLLFFFLSNSG